MKISIALCTYNGEQFLQEQLDSIAAQTLLPDELVVCDDCSNDSTMDILREFAATALFPVYLHQNETNLGTIKNFEKVILLCQNSIIALCDQDDVWKPHKLARLVEALQAHPEAGYVFSDADVVDEHLNPLGRGLWDSVGFKAERKERFIRGDQFRCLLERRLVTGATMAFRASVGKLAMPFPTDLGLVHDGWLSLVAAATGNLGFAVEEPLIAYRQHARQQIGAPVVADDPVIVPKKKKSLLSMYFELKGNQLALFAGWEESCRQVLNENKNILQQLQVQLNSPIITDSLLDLREFETHFLNRKTAMTTRGIGRYSLVFREARSGRYTRFSDSWRSIIRDLFL